MEKTKEIIKRAPAKMRPMLESVYEFNSKFILDKEQEKLLERTLFSIQQIDRKLFVKDEQRAYDDNALDIGAGQTISQPSTVSRMILLAEVEESDDVLEVGTGSGWNACLLAFLAYPGNVSSVERINLLKEKAEANVAKLRGYLKEKAPKDFQKLSRLNFYAENIFEAGKVWKKTYDKIIFTAGISSTQEEKKVEELASQLLKQGGILICPKLSGPLLIIKKDKGLKKIETKEEYVFVPLIGMKE